jgi:hypothetical protein
MATNTDLMVSELKGIEQAIKEIFGDDGLNREKADGSLASAEQRVWQELAAIAEAIRHITGGGGGSGGVDQTARDMAEAAQNTADSKEPSLGNFTPEVPPRRRYLSAIFNQNNPPSYRGTSWEPLPAFLDNAAQNTPTEAVQNNFNAWLVYQRPAADPGGVRIGKFETTATANKPAVFDGYTKFFTLLFHVEQYGSGRDSYQRGSGWVFSRGNGKFGPWAFIDYDTNGYQVTYRHTSDEVGPLTDLQTADKTSIVAAINELKARIDALENP